MLLPQRTLFFLEFQVCVRYMSSSIKIKACLHWPWPTCQSPLAFLLALPYALPLHLLLLSGVSLIFCVTVLTRHFPQSLLGFAPALKHWLPVLDNAHPCLKYLLVSGIPALLVSTGGSGMMRSLSLFSLPLPCTHYFSHTREGQAFKQLELVPVG